MCQSKGEPVGSPTSAATCAGVLPFPQLRSFVILCHFASPFSALAQRHCMVYGVRSVTPLRRNVAMEEYHNPQQLASELRVKGHEGKEIEDTGELDAGMTRNITIAKE
eukprot:294304-Pyramimonas_sp.AAC.2